MWLLTSESRRLLNLCGMTSSFQPLFLEASDLSISSMLSISNHSLLTLALVPGFSMSREALTYPIFAC